MLTRAKLLTAIVVVSGFALVGCPVVQTLFPALPVPVQLNAEDVPSFIGEAAVSAPIIASDIPQNPHLARNGKSNTHNDTYMSDTYEVSGPLGNNPEIIDSYFGGVCVSMAFDKAGRIVTIALGKEFARLLLVDPTSLEPISYLDLPVKPYVEGSFPAGSYFVLDDDDRVLIPTIDRTIWVVHEKDPVCNPQLELERVYDLTSVITDEDDQIGSVVPDFRGRLWFVTDNGVVGVVDPRCTCALRRPSIEAIALENEAIANSFAIDETGGVFVASDHAMYRFDLDASGDPVITWREEYDRGSAMKPGQHSQGTGTTPTLMGTDYVTITDNADEYMHVLVYKRAAQVEGERLVLSQAVFDANAGCTENSLIATDTSIIVENNYGYYGPAAVLNGQATEPGVTRIDLNPAGGGEVVWTSDERVPSVVSKMSVANGLVYTYCKDPGPNTTDAWYFTAIDFATGETVFKQLAGTGNYFNNHYAGLYLGPDGTVYVGVLGGIVAMRDQD